MLSGAARRAPLVCRAERSSPSLASPALTPACVDATVAVVVRSQVIHKLSERITNQLRAELSDHMRREMVLETEKNAEVAGKIGRYWPRRVASTHNADHRLS